MKNKIFYGSTILFFVCLLVFFCSFKIEWSYRKDPARPGWDIWTIHGYLDFRWLLSKSQKTQQISCQPNAIAPGEGVTLPDKDGITWVTNLGCQNRVCTANATRQNFGDILSFSGAITGKQGGEQTQDQIMSVNGKWKTFSVKATWDNQGCMVIP